MSNQLKQTDSKNPAQGLCPVPRRGLPPLTIVLLLIDPFSFQSFFVVMEA